MNLPDKIRDLREAKGMSQAALSEKSGLSATYISLIESGKKSPTLKSLQKISTGLDVPFPVLSFLALDEEDVAPEKRDAFKIIGPSVTAMLQEFFVIPEEV